MVKLNSGKRGYVLFLVCAATAIASPAQTFTTPHSGSITRVVPNETIALPTQTFTTLHSFDGTDGANPGYESLVQGIDGNFYGTTFHGGTSSACTGGCGTVFKMTPGGTLTTLHSFDGADGAVPFEGLVLATNGNFYGTTSAGGANGDGTVFEITPAGKLTTLHSFDGTDGCHPYAGLVQAANENFYGATPFCGAYDDGTVFEITALGALTTLHHFNNPGGAPGPNFPLVQSINGNLYGETYVGGAYGDGTVFEITAGGTLTTLHNFDGTDGEGLAGLALATDGNFYGPTYSGGANNTCTGDTLRGCGTVFKITPGGTLTTLYSFCTRTGCTDGEGPTDAGLVQATNGRFYGTTSSGGPYNSSGCTWLGDVGCGTVFQITAGGTLTTLHSFDVTDGSEPIGGLVQATDGKFYGTTFYGGASGAGTVFSLSVGLGPFVETLPTSGKVGTTVIILGNNLTSATSVSFNGTAAPFKVVSNSEITAVVPFGATTGRVQVVTTRGSFSSKVPFRVVPCPSCFSPMSPVGESGD